VSIKRYEEYKNTSINWANKIPKHWELLPTKRAFRRKKETNTGMKVENRLALTMKGVLKRSLDDLDGLQASEYETYQIFQEGDLAFKLIDLQNIKTSRVGIVPEEGIMSPAYIRLERTGRIEPKYAYWYFMKLYHECIFNELGGGVRQTIGPEELLSLPLTYPPKGEQHSIASFLDRETAKIDALIAEQQRLIELLQEKRQAVISHAVTKGLNPNVPMKDSGVEWLGEVPEHWLTTQLGRLCIDVADGPHYSPVYVNTGVPFLSARNIKVDRWELDDVKYVSESDCNEFDKKAVPEMGDVLYTKGGTTGVARVVDLPYRFQVWVHVAILKLRKTIADPHFIAYALNSSGCYEQSQLFTRGATNQDLGLTRMVLIQLALPPLDEQMEISSELDLSTKYLDELLSKAQDSLLLLGERRSALISAAVTGQIDVRGLVEEEGSEQ